MLNADNEPNKKFKVGDEVYYINCYMKWFLVPVSERKFEAEFVKSTILDIEEEDTGTFYWLDSKNQQIYEATSSMNYFPPESVLLNEKYVYKTYEEALQNSKELLKKLNDKYNGK